MQITSKTIEKEAGGLFNKISQISNNFVTEFSITAFTTVTILMLSKFFHLSFTENGITILNSLLFAGILILSYLCLVFKQIFDKEHKTTIFTTVPAIVLSVGIFNLFQQNLEQSNVFGTVSIISTYIGAIFWISAYYLPKFLFDEFNKHFGSFKDTIEKVLFTLYIPITIVLTLWFLISNLR